MVIPAPQIQTESNLDELNSQLDMCESVTGKLRDYLMTFFRYYNICSLEDIDINLKDEYYLYVKKTLGLTKAQQRCYMSLLDQAEAAYYAVAYEDLYKRLSDIICSRAIRNKVLVSLVEQDISDISQIDYYSRETYLRYIKKTITESKIYEYVKEWDRVKLSSIENDNETYPLKSRELTYTNNKIFLLYHPNYEVAMLFYYIRDKEKDLVYDFGVDISTKLKKQVFGMLKELIQAENSQHERRVYIIALNYLYKYCVEAKIEDIEQLTDEDIKGFQKYISSYVGTQLSKYMQIVNKTRKYLFIKAESINWDANLWFVDRMRIREIRLNPSRPIKSFNFGCIRNEKNRSLIKTFMKYEIGRTSKLSLQTIRTIYYDLIQFLCFCDRKDIYIKEITNDGLLKYLDELEEKQIQPETYNRYLISIAIFLNYLSMCKFVQKPNFPYVQYLKQTYPRHNDRTIDRDTFMEIMSTLHVMPMHLRLMIIHLAYSIIRESEVCTIRGDAYCFDGKDAWIKVYQIKMTKEKKIPIPYALYDMMQNYIRDNNILPHEYIFRNSKKGPYNADKFSKEVKKYLEENGISDYTFKSHDFRHTLATNFRNNGVSIEVLRDLLGHDDSQMTLNYIDYQQQEVDRLNAEYYSEHRFESLKGVRKDGRD